ncbi:MAG TPA: hypothetical protein DDW50_00860 [Firmicutes bacterium]|jgi:hypothetical protein|nr:hypothetical protein [Bacillota bacterium]
MVPGDTGTYIVYLDQFFSFLRQPQPFGTQFLLEVFTAVKRKFLIFLLFSMVMSLLATYALAVGVVPLTVELNGKPGDTMNFNIKLNPGGQTEKLKLSLEKIIQQPTGDLQYSPFEQGGPPASWIAIPTTVGVSPGASSQIDGTVKVPLNAQGGTYLALLKVAPEEPTRKGAFDVSIQYGVRLYIRIESAGLRPRVQVTGLDLIKDEKGTPLIQARIKNISAADFLTTASATLRDSNQKLIQRVELRPTYFWRNKISQARLLPGGELNYIGPVTEPLSPGEYELRLFYHYSENGQLLQAKNIQIHAGDYVFASPPKALKLDQNELIFEARPGVLSLKGLKMQNRLDKPVKVVFIPEEVAPDYPYSIFANNSLTLRTGSPLTIGAGQTEVAIISVQIPREAPVRANYGSFNLQVYSAGDKPVLLDEIPLSLEAITVGNQTRTAEVLSISGDKEKSGYRILAVLKNTGTIKLTPVANLVLKDKANKSLGTLLSLKTDDAQQVALLPNQTMNLTAFLPKLDPATYQADVTVLEGDKVIQTVIMPIHLKK